MRVPWRLGDSGGGGRLLKGKVVSIRPNCRFDSGEPASDGLFVATGQRQDKPSQRCQGSSQSLLAVVVALVWCSYGRAK